MIFHVTKKLTLAEASMLAGIPNAPSAYAPTVNFEYTCSRQKKVVSSMAEYGYLSEDEANDLYKQIEKHPDYMVGSMLYVTSHFKKALDQAYSKNINYLSAISTQEQRKMYDPKGLDRYTAKKFFLFILKIYSILMEYLNQVSKMN